MSSLLLKNFLVVYAALFPIVNPLGNAPIFLEVTRHCSPALRYKLAWRVTLGSFLLLLASLFLGSHVLEFFGITLPVVRVAGGLVVATVGWSLLNQGPSPDDADAGAPRRLDDAKVARQVFYPLTMPLTVGPGSIATAIALGSQKPLAHAGLQSFVLEAVAAIGALAAVAATIYFSYRFADRLERVLGPNGTNVLVRLFAFVLLCIGAQIMWAGAAELIEQAKHF
ncbi:MAG: MarC family protein [Verrucomicrobium sp.]|nr:MarC family protein [Verrucomicrobium sp.]